MTVAELGQLNLEELPPLRGACRSLDCFQKLEQIGEGTYGQVYMGKEVMTGEIVALKRIRTENEKEGFPISAIREIKVLNTLHHENIVKLKEVVLSQDETNDQALTKESRDSNKYSGGVYLVFEYMDHDLTGLSDRPGLRFTVPQIKCYMKQLLTGLCYCHANEVLHRDIKGANVLLNNNGSLKIADFGLSYSSRYRKENFTNRVITLPYRPPELLLGATNYGSAVDMWSAGCIFAELLHGKPIMFGRNEPEQLHKIFELCGSPDEVNWPSASKIRWYNNFKPAKPMRRRLREVFRHFDPHALDLLDKMLILDPSKRISASGALAADYFQREPLPCDPKSLPKYEASHEFQTKRKRQQQRLKEEIAKRQNLRCPPPHARLPPIQHRGQVFQEHWHERSYSMNQLQRPLPALPSNPYGEPPVDVGLPNRYTPSGNLSAGYNQTHGVQVQVGGTSVGSYPPHVRGGSYAASNMSNRSATPSYGAGAAGPPGFSHRGPNTVTSNRNQQYGWQQ